MTKKTPAARAAGNTRLTPLVRKIERVDQLSERLRTRDDPVATAELVALSAELADTFRTVRRNAHELEAASRRAAHASETATEITRALTAGPRKATPPQRVRSLRVFSESSTGSTQQDNTDDQGLGLAPFLMEVSKSVIAAQRSLDLASVRNLVSPATSLVPPTYYAIPSIRAELKVGVKAATGEAVKLVFFSTSTTKENFSENTVAFELVATPPPPGARGPFTAPIPPFLAVDAERNAVLTIVEAALKNKVGAADFIALYAPHTSSAMVARQPSVGEDRVEYLAVWLAAESNNTGTPTRAAVVSVKSDHTVASVVVPPSKAFSKWTSKETSAYLSEYFPLVSLLNQWTAEWLATVSLSVPAE